MYDTIKFNDGWIKYKLTYASSLLMNGLKDCNTDNYSLAEINKKPMYLDFFESKEHLKKYKVVKLAERFCCVEKNPVVKKVT